MPHQFENILVACDRCRKGERTHSPAIEVARRLGAKLDIAYIINVERLTYFRPMHAGVIVPVFQNNKQLEAQLVADGREEIKSFGALCEKESVPHDKDIYEATPDAAWAELARTTDLVLIVPVEEDFAGLWHCFDARFWRIAKRANRPVLLPGPAGLAVERIYLFYSNRRTSSTALPHVAALAKTLAVPVTVQLAREPRRLYGRIEECQEYLSGHGIDVRVADQIGARHVRAVAEQAEKGLLVFDRPFSRGMGKTTGRRLVGRLIKDSQNTILLCP